MLNMENHVSFNNKVGSEDLSRNIEDIIDIVNSHTYMIGESNINGVNRRYYNMDLDDEPEIMVQESILGRYLYALDDISISEPGLGGFITIDLPDFVDPNRELFGSAMRFIPSVWTYASNNGYFMFTENDNENGINIWATDSNPDLFPVFGFSEGHQVNPNLSFDNNSVESGNSR